MNRISLLASMVLCVCLLLGAGWWKGSIDNRWGAADSLRTAGEHLERLPESFGDWEMQATHELEEPVARMLECTGAVHRTYMNRTTGEVVSLALIVGPPGPTVMHVPEICYSAQNYELEGAPYPLDVEGGAGRAEFRAMDFRSPGVSAARLRVCFAWGAGGDWSVPYFARFKLGGEPYLYKLQIAIVSDSEGGEDDPRKVFLSDFLPFVNQHLAQV